MAVEHFNKNVGKLDAKFFRDELGLRIEKKEDLEFARDAIDDVMIELRENGDKRDFENMGIVAIKKLGIKYDDMLERNYYSGRKEEHEFDALQQRDFIKRELCDIFGFRLCAIPFTYSCYEPEKLKEFIISWLIENKIM